MPVDELKTFDPLVSGIDDDDPIIANGEVIAVGTSRPMAVSMPDPPTKVESPAAATASAVEEPLVSEPVVGELDPLAASVPTTSSAPPDHSSTIKKNGVFVVGVVVAVMLVAAVFLSVADRWLTRSTPTDSESLGIRNDYLVSHWSSDYTGSQLAAAGECVPYVDPQVRTGVDDLVAALGSSVYQTVPLDDELTANFDFFSTYALQTNAHHCFYLEYCQNIFAHNVPFALAFARRAYVQRHFGPEAERAGTYVGQWFGTNGLISDIKNYFGIEAEAVDFSLYPVSETSSLSDIYDQAQDSFSVPNLPALTGPYHYQLVEVKRNQAIGQTVYIAEARLDDDCTLALNGGLCTCPTARYYLMTNLDPETGEEVYVQEFIQLTGGMAKIDQLPNS